MFRLPTPRLLSGLKSALRPAMPRFKVSAFWLLILAWIFLLVWIWWKGPTWTLYEEQWLKPLANRWLATAAWGIIALMWLTVRVMKRLQQLEKMQKQQREEAVDPLSVDPRGLPEFSAIREEINKASHPSQPELNWKLVESLALAIFKANGVDLHTATYYTLARTRTQGLAGFCEGAELLAAMVSHDWDKFWPQGGPARTEMLDWFNSRTGNILRQQISFAESDLPLIVVVK